MQKKARPQGGRALAVEGGPVFAAAMAANKMRLPLAKRLKIADQMRQGKQSKAISVMDVTPEAVTALMQQHNASLMIHGHTHRPAIHDLPFSLTDGHSGQQLQAQRIVLGDWYTQGSVLRVDAGGVALSALPL